MIYRRLDDDFLDPLSFRADSALGVPGLLSVYRAGRVTLANAIGTGIADDKSTYLYVPDMIRFYLGQEPILSNVPTWRCARLDELSHVLDRMHELVVKEVHGAGGYGMLVGPSATRAEVEAFKDRVRANPPITSPSRRWRCPPCPPMSSPAWRRATSTCALRAVRQGHPHGARRTVPRGADRRLAGGQQQPGRRHQGYVGTGGLNHAEPNRRQPVLDVPLHRARREHGPHAGREPADVAAAAGRAGARGLVAGRAAHLRAAGPVPRPARRHLAARRAALHGARRRQSLVHLFLRARRPRERARACAAA